jgi:hypothetical protein
MVGFSRGLEPDRPVFTLQTRTAGGLPGHIANTNRQKPLRNVQSCVGYGVCFGTRGIEFSNSRDVNIVQDTCCVFNTGGKEDGSAGVEKGYISASSCDILVQLVLLVNKDKQAKLSSCTTIRHLINGEHRAKI